MCECIALADDQLRAHNTRVAQLLGLASDKLRPAVVTVKADPKKKGKPVTLMCTYCPFCGVKL